MFTHEKPPEKFSFIVVFRLLLEKFKIQVSFSLAL